MIKISKTGRMSVVCDKCGKQHPSARGLSLVAEYDDKEYICQKCKALDGANAPDNQQVLPTDVLEGEGTLPEPPRQ